MYSHQGEGLSILDLRTGEIRSVGPFGAYEPVWSPDGQRIAFGYADDIGVLDLGTGQVTRLTYRRGCYGPDWSPDGTRLVYTDVACTFAAPESCGMWTVEVATGRRTQLLADIVAEPRRTVLEPRWSPDGDRIAYTDLFAGTLPSQEELMIFRLSDSSITRLTYDDLYEGRPSWSPDGQKLVYDVVTGSYPPVDSITGVWIMNADGTDQHRLPLPPGNTLNHYAPVWSPTCNMIAYSGFNSENCTTSLWIMTATGASRRRLTGPSFYP